MFHDDDGKRNVGGWWPNPNGVLARAKIGETVESELIFDIPLGELPWELICRGEINLNVKLPLENRLPWSSFRKRTHYFGFVPTKGSRAKDAVPSLTKVLLQDKEGFRTRVEAAKILGEIGPAAIEAVPALKKVIEASRPLQFNLGDDDLCSAAKMALGRINPQE